MKFVKAINLKVGQEVKFRDIFGTHTMVITNVSRAHRKEMMIKGVILTTTNKDAKFDDYQVGSDNFFFARYKTQIRVLG